MLYFHGSEIGASDYDQRYVGNQIRAVMDGPTAIYATSTALSTLEARVAALEAYHTT